MKLWRPLAVTEENKSTFKQDFVHSLVFPSAVDRGAAHRYDTLLYYATNLFSHEETNAQPQQITTPGEQTTSKIL